jgi:hypothetical protein
MVTNKVYVNGLSVIAPGLFDADKSMAILRGEVPWEFEPLPKLVPSSLPANERRRTTSVIKLALQTMQPLLHADDDLERSATIFASSDGDLETEDKICAALTQNEKMVSPTQFHNSVHNAPAGYWAIASSMSSASTSLSAENFTFVAGLIESVTQAICDEQTVLFVAYDMATPSPFDTVRHIDYSLGIGLRLGIKQEQGCLGSINLSLENTEKKISSCQNTSLEPLYQGNPVGQGIPLLEALAKKSETSIVLPHMMNSIMQINVSQ